MNLTKAIEIAARIRYWFWRRMETLYGRREDAAYDEAQHCAALRRFCHTRRLEASRNIPLP